MKSAKIILAILFLLSLFVPSGFVHVAHADVAPPPAPQLGGLEPFGYQDTNVQMVYERVEMELRPYYWSVDDFSKARVNVTAYFTMHNRGNVSESIQVIFPLESFTNCEAGAGMGNNYTYYFVNADSFEVMINGQGVLVQNIVTKHPHEGCEQMTWAGFDVTFPIDEDVTIRVQYMMESMDMDLMQNIEYILETGAGWAGPIQRGYVIVKFPYEATTENVLSESTPGYQFLHNEIFWSFENLEPTSANNIQITIVSPAAWQEISYLRRELKENPALPEEWLRLAQNYEYLSTWHGTNLRNNYYYRKVATTYEQGIAANPNSASLYANYAQFVHNDCCFLWGAEINPADQTRVLNLANKALALDPENPIANQVIEFVVGQSPNLTFTPPATLPPTPTPLFTVTPSITPSVTITYIPEGMPIVMTVIQTEIVYPPTSTPRPVLMATSSPTEIVVQEENQNEASTSPMILGALVLFAAGMGVGRLWSKRAGK